MCNHTNLSHGVCLDCGETMIQYLADKVEFAMDFVESMRTTDPRMVLSLIRHEAGDELATFFNNYAKHVVESNPDANPGALMMLGYLIGRLEGVDPCDAEVRDTSPTPDFTANTRLLA